MIWIAILAIIFSQTNVHFDKMTWFITVSVPTGHEIGAEWLYVPLNPLEGPDVEYGVYIVNKYTYRKIFFGKRWFEG